MMRLKIPLILLLLFWSVSNLLSQDKLKNMICVVKPQYQAGIKTFYGEYGRALAREGYMRSGTLLRMMENGGFGSGVIIHYNGKFYVLTNYHVVEHTQAVSLEFNPNTDESRQWDGCLIVARDKDYDLALIALPPDAGIQSGFVFPDTSPKEGTEVWTAGFPGLGNKPSWQLGKGIISNETVKDSTLSNAKLPYVIQHTAQIDAGSSGGALLIASSKENIGYSIVGINTWKARGRENANFAIPGSAVQAFLKNVNLNESIAGSKQQVEKRTKELISLRNSDSYKAILPFVSESYIFTIPSQTFVEMFAEASKDAKDDADKALRRVEPFDAFRIVIADAIHKKLRKTEPVYVDTKESSGKIVAGMTLKGNEIEMGWAAESGNWVLSGSSLLKETGTGKAHTRIWDDIDRSIYAGIGFSLDGKEKTNYTLGTENRYSQYFALIYELTVGKKIGYTEEADSKGQMLPVTRDLGYVGLTFGPNIQVPLKFCPVYTIPFVKVPVGVNLGSDASDINVGVRPGIRFAIKLGKKDKFLYLDAEYRYRHAFSQSDSYAIPRSTSMFGLCLGFAY